MHPCPACASTRVGVGPLSHDTGQRIGHCRDCGARFVHEVGQLSRETRVQPVPEALHTVDDFSRWVGIKREQVGGEAWREALGLLQESIRTAETPRLYDVGAGDGEFLAIARDEFGFEVTGNEIMESAVNLARQRYEVDLELGDIAELEHKEEFDAVTLWCVLAHVPDGDALLSDVRDMLKPGGMLFLQTPRWTAADGAAGAVQGLSHGRVSKLRDRRIGRHHRILHTRASIAAQLHRLGFVEIDARPKMRYTLTSRAYLASMNPPEWFLDPASRLLDRAIASRVAPRIVLDVRARRDPFS